MAKAFTPSIVSRLLHAKGVGIGILCFVVLNAVLLQFILKTDVFVEMSSTRDTAVQVFYLDPFFSPDTYSQKASETKEYNSPGRFAALHFRLPASVEYRRLRFDFGSRSGEQFSLRAIRIQRNFIFSYFISGEKISDVFVSRNHVADWKQTARGSEWSSSGNDCYLVSNSKFFQQYPCESILWINLLLVSLAEFVILLLSICVGRWLEEIFSAGKWALKKSEDYFSRHPFHGIILSVLIIFFLFYRNYIWGPYYYCFQDIGSDTIRSYLPYYRFLIENLKSGSFQMMLWQMGLGVSAVTLTMQLLDPFSLLLFFVPLDRFMEAMIWIALVKYLVIACFSWLYFKRIARNPYFIWIGVMLWTFSSYNVLWGQHYQFLTAMVFFTINMYLLELLLSDKRKSFFFCVLNYALLSMFSVYFFSMIGIFSAFYLLARSLLRGFRLKKWLTDELQLFLNGMLGFMISAWISVPWLVLFGKSGRSDVGAKAAANFLAVTSFEDVMIYLGRLISNNYFGVLSHFVQHNYYEATVLASSLLVFWAAAYYLFIRPQWRYWFIAGMMVLPLAVLFFRHVFAYRWTFIFVFSSIVIIVNFLEDYIKEPKRNRQVNVFALMFLFFVLVILYAYFSVCSSVLLYVTILSGIYLLFFSWLAASRICRFLPFLLMGVVAIELFLVHNPTINQRHPLQKTFFNFRAFQGDIYHKVKPVVDESSADGRILFLPSRDKIQHYGWPLIYNYSGVSTYNSLFPATIKKYAPEAVDVFNSNKFSFLLDPATELLLGISTHISIDSGAKLFGYGEPENLNGVWKSKRQTELPFGYLYTHRISIDQLKCFTNEELSRVRLSHFNFVDGSDAAAVASLFPESFPKQEALPQESIPLIRNGSPITTKNRVSLPQNVSGKLSYSGTVSIADPQSGFHMLELEYDGRYPCEFLTICDGHMRVFRTEPGRRVYRMALPSETVSEICFMVNNRSINHNSRLMSLSLIRQKDFDKVIDAAAAAFKSSPVTNISYAHSTWRGKVDNRSGRFGMLCIPITFQDGWQATVSGRAEKVYGINNGLLGIPVPPGEHEVTVRWSAPGAHVGNILSVFGILITGGLCFVFMRRKNYELCKIMEK